MISHTYKSEASDTENLELHLKTCEIYECKSCEHESKQISKMKKHIAENKENCGTSCIYHIKIDRNNESEADYKEYKHILKLKQTNLENLHIYDTKNYIETHFKVKTNKLKKLHIYYTKHYSENLQTHRRKQLFINENAWTDPKCKTTKQ